LDGFFDGICTSVARILPSNKLHGAGSGDTQNPTFDFGYLALMGFKLGHQKLN
jgi:hypothetical protein